VVLACDVDPGLYLPYGLNADSSVDGVLQPIPGNVQNLLWLAKNALASEALKSTQINITDLLQSEIDLSDFTTWLNKIHAQRNFLGRQGSSQQALNNGRGEVTKPRVCVHSREQRTGSGKTTIPTTSRPHQETTKSLLGSRLTGLAKTSQKQLRVCCVLKICERVAVSFSVPSNPLNPASMRVQRCMAPNGFK